ncbi:translation elongation factor Ts [candidate division WOR-3 bacterium]|uniref:Elongation factor Ts n=1 Tax=candidate division WOR-3 bacterium TaxID=2052148 RepID=A0A660SGI3_UNCW3|nr:MAG: translation elongation factor Ts [candidate division WOR-3 bacterium]
MKVDIDKLKELRARTGAGVVDCRNALLESGGDLDRAIEILRKKGIVKAAKKAGRITKEGIIDAYIHPGERIGVILEVNCETDFVARNQEFRRFVHDIALQIAATDPIGVSRSDIPGEIIEKEKAIYKSQIDTEKKPPHIVDKIIQGKLEKFYRDVCLLEQPFVKNPDITIGDYLKEQIAKFGENIVIRRFTRYVLGE